MTDRDPTGSDAVHLRLPLDRATLDRLAAEFQHADPFPHLVLHDVLDGDPDALLADVPSVGWDGWTNRFRNRYQRDKFTCDDLEALGGPLGDLILELQAPRFLEFLTAVTGIEKLIPDPYLHGGGLHMSGPGGVLEPHTDFHTYEKLDLFRQINALLYLNPVWEEQWGGCLELFADPQAKHAVQRILPTWGTLVVFRTDDTSIHGFPTPIAEGRWRRSIALYYYTAKDRPGYFGDGATYWMPHASQRSATNRVRQTVYQALVSGQRLLARAAGRTRPPEPETEITPPLRNR